MADPEYIDEPYFPGDPNFPLDDGLLPYGFFWGYFASTVYFIFLAFWLWMIIDCIRRDPDRMFWIWVLIFVPFFGAAIYFFARFIPARNVRVPQGLQKFSRGKELKQLKYQAMQIGNAHHFIQWGDGLRETGQIEQARDAYNKALEKDGESLPGLWGSAQVEYQQKNYELAETRLRKILAIDSKYKFGDVSLCLGKTLFDQDQVAEAKAHLQQHIKQWRHPEGIYLLAQIHVRDGETEQARALLESILIDIEGSPTGIARQQREWKVKAQKLLRSLG